MHQTNSGKSPKFIFPHISYFHIFKTTPQLLEHIGLQDMKVGEKKVKVKIVNQQEKKEKTFQVKKKTSSD